MCQFLRSMLLKSLTMARGGGNQRKLRKVRQRVPWSNGTASKKCAGTIGNSKMDLFDPQAARFSSVQDFKRLKLALNSLSNLPSPKFRIVWCAAGFSEKHPHAKGAVNKHNHIAKELIETHTAKWNDADRARDLCHPVCVICVCELRLS